MGGSGPTPLRGSLPLVQSRPGGCPRAGSAQWYQGLWAIAYLSDRQWRRLDRGSGQGVAGCDQGETGGGQSYTPPGKLHPA